MTTPTPTTRPEVDVDALLKRIGRRRGPRYVSMLTEPEIHGLLDAYRERDSLRSTIATLEERNRDLEAQLKGQTVAGVKNPMAPEWFAEWLNGALKAGATWIDGLPRATFPAPPVQARGDE